MTTRIRRCAAVLSAEVGQDLVLMSVQSGTYCSLDDIGTDIWRRLEQPHAIGDLCVALARDYAAETGAIEGDILTLLKGMTRQHLIEEAGD